MGKIKVGIIGLGLIGASILEALYEQEKYELFCQSNSSFKSALKYTKNASNDIRIVQGCDIVFVCTEISKTLDMLQKLDSFLDKKTLVVDVASTKKGLLNLSFNFDFILSHPMAGTEKSGFEAREKELFKGARWLIEKNNDTLEQVICDLGAIPLKINMEFHDFMAAQISHLPALLSFALFDSTKDESRQIASSGFRDTTRLAMTNSKLMLGMIKNNGENIDLALNLLIEKLNHLKKLSDSEKIKVFEEISNKRTAMYDNNGKNIFKI